MRNYWPLALFITLSLSIISVAYGQESEQVTVTVQIRFADGQPANDESLTLLPFSAENDVALACETDDHGICTWHVDAGLYELLTAHPLDNLSRLAVAESGLRGLGITVGSDPITYTLTLQSNGNIYFDTAPNSLTPVPFVPSESNIHWHRSSSAVATSTVPMADSDSVNETAVIEPVSAENPSLANSSILSLYLLLGLLLGCVIFLIPIIRQRHNRQEQDHA